MNPQARGFLCMPIVSSVCLAICLAECAVAMSFRFDSKMVAADGEWLDELGNSIDLSGNVAIVGAHRDVLGASRDPFAVHNSTGSAYLFDVRSGNQLHKLVPLDGGPNTGDGFGRSVAIDGSTALVGSPNHDRNDINDGSAYLFDVQSGSLTGILQNPYPDRNDFFGVSVALSQDVALIGSSGDPRGTAMGSAHLFDVTTGDLLHTLAAPDGSREDFFGSAVAIADGVALIAALNEEVGGVRSGAAYLFDVETGSFLHRLVPPDPTDGGNFGRSVAIAAGKAIVGSNRDDSIAQDSGAAYIFDVSTGGLLHTLTDPNGGGKQQFGWSVDISDEVAAVGSIFGNDGRPGVPPSQSETGNVVLFDVATGTPIQELLAPDRKKDFHFGESVAISGEFVVVGSRGDDFNGRSSGSAYSFLVPEPTVISASATVCVFFCLKRVRKGRG